VKLLIDQNLAARVAVLLRDAGHDAVHVSERGMSSADDDQVLQLALAEERVLVSEDTDFGALLARSGAALPSFVLIRSAERLTTEARANLLVSTLPRVESELEAGAIVVLGRSRVRVRPLPLPPSG
jgi:predicted nuclease of predicted toxin-antitoxin system